ERQWVLWRIFTSSPANLRKALNGTVAIRLHEGGPDRLRLFARRQAPRNVVAVLVEERLRIRSRFRDSDHRFGSTSSSARMILRTVFQLRPVRARVALRKLLFRPNLEDPIPSG